MRIIAFLFLLMATTANAQEVGFTWDPPVVSDGVTGYNLYVLCVDDTMLYDICDGSVLWAGDALQAVLDLMPGKRYMVAVTATSSTADGELESGFSNVLDFVLTDSPRNLKADKVK